MSAVAVLEWVPVAKCLRQNQERRSPPGRAHHRNLEKLVDRFRLDPCSLVVFLEGYSFGYPL
ncbi:MAG: hypothetical protein JWO91_2603 [Acidobacteriaceae bacterium]|nr:hypothetical protein [Acidobacteriaceae bacterium]